MAHLTLPAPTEPAETLPPELREFAQELAVAVHKRGIYPPGHPMQQGAVEAVLARLTTLLGARSDLAIGVGRSHLVIEGVSTDPNNPLMRELAERMHDHLLGGVRLTGGIAQGELDEFVSRLAEPTARGGEAMGSIARELQEQWPHVQVVPVAFDQLALLDGEGGEARSPSAAQTAKSDVVWTALACVALDGGGEGGNGMLNDPAVLAQAFEQRMRDPEGRSAVVDALLRTLDALDSGNVGGSVLRQRVTQMMEMLSEDTVRLLLEMGGDRDRRQAFLHEARHVFGARAVVQLVCVAAAQDGAPVSSSMLRLLEKLARGATSGRSGARQMDQALRRVVGRLLRDWTLDDPNPEAYSVVLAEISHASTQTARDRHRDTCEPERVLEISLDAGVVTPSTESALGRLVMRDGVAATFERLMRFPPSPEREALEGRLVNDAMLREQLTAERPEVQVLAHAVDRLGTRAVEPLVKALERRDDADAPWIVELVMRLGNDALAPIGAMMPTLPPRALRHLIAVFERLDRWPTGVEPLALARHADAHVRREAIRYLLKHEGTREQGTRLGLVDPDLRTMGLAIRAVMRGCSPEAARILMRRFDEPSLGGEVRARMARAIASVRTNETLEWLLGQVLTTRWLSGALRLRKPTLEVLAIVGAIAQHYAANPKAAPVLELARRSRDDAMRRSAMTRGDGPGRGG